MLNVVIIRSAFTDRNNRADFEQNERNPLALLVLFSSIISSRQKTRADDFGNIGPTRFRMRQKLSTSIMTVP